MENNQATALEQSKENTKSLITDFKVLAKIRQDRLKEDDEAKKMDIDIYSAKLRKAFRHVPPRFEDSEITNDKINKLLNDKKIIQRQCEIYSGYTEYFIEGNGMYLYGKCGTGKTYNLYGIYKILKLNSIKTKIVSMSELISELKTNFDSKYTENENTKILKDESVLLIDDFGTEKISEWSEEIIYRLINYRYEYNKTTFISSNLSMSELAERVGDRIASRIIGMCDLIKFEGEDKRLTK